MAKPSTYVAVSPTQRAGSLAEARALDYLCSQGLRPVAANVRLRPGEIDLIMADGGQCVFIEVRQRTSPRYGGAAASITAAKQARVRAAAQAWLLHRLGAQAWPAVRFDVIAIDGEHLEWLQGAF
ncbi:MAG: YraN family protein [Burkholderiales bacterium]|jgi:putative endonuclease|nr:YraN family protein [Burkholderiales bacterium]